jgi:hypothetical protein
MSAAVGLLKALSAKGYRIVPEGDSRSREPPGHASHSLWRSGRKSHDEEQGPPTQNVAVFEHILKTATQDGMTPLILKRGSVSRSSGRWGEDAQRPICRVRQKLGSPAILFDLYKDRSSKRCTRIGAQDIVVNRAAARGNGPHRFDGRFDFGVRRHGFPLKPTNSTLLP